MSVSRSGKVPSGPPLHPSAGKSTKEMILQSVSPPGAVSSALIPAGFDWNKHMQHSLEALYAKTPVVLKPGAYIIALLQTLISWVSKSRGKFVDKNVLANQVQGLAEAVLLQYPNWRATAKGELLERKIGDLSRKINESKVLSRKLAKKMLRETADELKVEFLSAKKYTEMQSALKETRHHLKTEITTPDVNAPRGTAGNYTRAIKMAKKKLTELLEKNGFTKTEIEQLGLDAIFTDWGKLIDTKVVPSQDEFLSQYAQIEKQLNALVIEKFQTTDTEQLDTIHHVFETVLAHIPLFQTENIEAKKEFVESIKKTLHKWPNLHLLNIDHQLAFKDAEYADFLPSLGRKRDALLKILDAAIAIREQQKCNAEKLKAERLFLSQYLSDYRLAKDMAVLTGKVQLSIEELLQAYGPQETRSDSDKLRVQEDLDKVKSENLSLLSPVKKILSTLGPDELLSHFDKLRMQQALALEAQREIDDFVETNKRNLPLELQTQLPSLIAKIQEEREEAKRALEKTGKPPKPNILELFDLEKKTAALMPIVETYVASYPPDSLEVANFFLIARVAHGILQSYDNFYYDPTLFSGPLSSRELMNEVSAIRETNSQTKWGLRLADLIPSTPADATMSAIIAEAERLPDSDTTS